MVRRLVRRGAWWFVCAAVILAVVKTVPPTPVGAWEWLQARAVTAKEWVQAFTDDAEQRLRSTAPAPRVLPSPSPEQRSSR